MRPIYRAHERRGSLGVLRHRRNTERALAPDWALLQEFHDAARRIHCGVWLVVGGGPGDRP